MRIIGGTLGGRRFQPPAGIPARPTTDLAREGLFNSLQNALALEDISALELFGGTGSVSYELASRGAASVVLVEKDAKSVAFIKKTADDFKIGHRLRVVRGDVFSFLKKDDATYDLIFADPPYALPQLAALPALVLGAARLNAGGLFVLEHDGTHHFERHPHFKRVKKYGDTYFSFFEERAEGGSL